MIRCAHCPQRHTSVDQVRECADDFYADEELSNQIAWAEDAWLRVAEAGTPDSWRDEDLERMAEASGLPIPPGFR